jgi:hypothetical protein
VGTQRAHGPLDLGEAETGQHDRVVNPGAVLEVDEWCDAMMPLRPFGGSDRPINSANYRDASSSDSQPFVDYGRLISFTTIR